MNQKFAPIVRRRGRLARRRRRLRGGLAPLPAGLALRGRRGVLVPRRDAELPGRGVGLRQPLLKREGPADVQQREPAFGSPVNF